MKAGVEGVRVQGYFADNKQGPYGDLNEGGGVLMSEVPLWWRSCTKSRPGFERVPSHITTRFSTGRAHSLYGSGYARRGCRGGGGGFGGEGAERERERERERETAGYEPFREAPTVVAGADTHVEGVGVVQAVVEL